ncbi:hypothetical protein [Solemya velesiana gill symbiont]|uniref:Uncharacterized protein n=1 Tax=Solemya velesiana gill symbiont TaxID=1918948 RepID=A0A1T2KMC7_9GAMM|nr:hypothetical protein [Solemya velesiana gill symbiont]OOZ33876.1 hypothetical protein BOW51_12410 [Solemya velesiana gill symbiont]
MIKSRVLPKGLHTRFDYSSRSKRSHPFFAGKIFPQPIDIERDPEGIIKRIDRVFYDLEIYNASDLIPHETVLFQHGLIENEYRMQTELEPCRKYAWSVRARFNDGPYMRATEWAGNYYYPRSARNRYLRSSEKKIKQRRAANTFLSLE